MKKLAKGFTLIELMIVVAIIGILAAIAIPNFVKYQLRSKFSEGATNVEGLRKAEEALQQGERALNGVPAASYVAGQYWNLGGAAMPTMAAGPGTAKVAWSAAQLALANTADWSMEGATYFQYTVAAAGALCPGIPVGTQSGMCYSISAQSNLDGNGTPAWVTLVRPATSNPALMEALLPAAAQTAYPGTVAGGSTCVDRAGVTIYRTPCVPTGPDVF